MPVGSEERHSEVSFDFQVMSDQSVVCQFMGLAFGICIFILCTFGIETPEFKLRVKQFKFRSKQFNVA